MADTKKILDLEGLSYYNEKVKETFLDKQSFLEESEIDELFSNFDGNISTTDNYLLEVKDNTVVLTNKTSGQAFILSGSDSSDIQNAVNFYLSQHPEMVYDDTEVKEEISQLSESIADIYDKVESVFDGEYIFHDGYILNGLEIGQVCDYKKVLEGSNFKCVYIPGLRQGDKFSIKTNDAGSARAYAWLASDGSTVYAPEKYKTTTLTEIECPENASILVCNLRIDSTYEPVFFRHESLKNLYEKINGLNLNRFVEKNGTRQVAIQNCDFTTVEKSNNRCNPSNLMWDKGISSSGEIIDSIGYVLTGLIPVENTYAFFAMNRVPISAIRLGLYKEDGAFLRVSYANSYDVSEWDYIRAYFPYNARNDVYFVGFNGVQSIVPTYDNYADKVTIEKQYLPLLEEKNPFYGLNAVAFGTSLTARAYEDHKYDFDTHGYLTYLREYSGMSIDNQGIGGATILSTQNEKSIYNAITSYTAYSNKNVCILEGFINDWYKNGANTLGVYTDDGDSTVCGRVRKAIKHILNQNQYITLFVVLDHYGKLNETEDFRSEAINNGYTIYQYFEEIAKVCESLGVIVIKEYALSEISELAPQYLADYIHLNDLGAKQSAITIWNVMKNHSPKF